MKNDVKWNVMNEEIRRKTKNDVGWNMTVDNIRHKTNMAIDRWFKLEPTTL